MRGNEIRTRPHAQTPTSRRTQTPNQAKMDHYSCSHFQNCHIFISKCQSNDRWSSWSTVSAPIKICRLGVIPMSISILIWNNRNNSEYADWMLANVRLTTHHIDFWHFFLTKKEKWQLVKATLICCKWLAYSDEFEHFKTSWFKCYASLSQDHF